MWEAPHSDEKLGARRPGSLDTAGSAQRRTADAHSETHVGSSKLGGEGGLPSRQLLIWVQQQCHCNWIPLPPSPPPHPCGMPPHKPRRRARTCVLLVLAQVLLITPEAPALGGVRHVGLAACAGNDATQRVVSNQPWHELADTGAASTHTARSGLTATNMQPH